MKKVFYYIGLLGFTLAFLSLIVKFFIGILIGISFLVSGLIMAQVVPSKKKKNEN